MAECRSVALSEDVTAPASLAERLKARFLNRTAVVAIFGLGYVGLPLAVDQARVGFEVVGLDNNPYRVNLVNEGRNYIGDVDDSELRRLVKAGRLRASSEPAAIEEADVVVVCVPTPLTRNGDPDLSAVVAVATQMGQHLRPGQLVTLESTTYPGTTQEVVRPLLEAGGLVAGRDFFLAFSPERLDPGNKGFNGRNTPKVVGGVTPVCGELAAIFYSQTVSQVAPVSTPEVAELTKVFENTYRAVNIALVNELALLCDRMGIDVWEVVEAAATKPFGIQTFYPGPGVGGHCIPIDPLYLTWKAREYDFHTRFIELAAEINSSMPRHVAGKVAAALNRAGKPLKGSRILVLGVTYKRDVADIREAPALKLIPLLENQGAEVVVSDPYLDHVLFRGSVGIELRPVALEAAQLEAADCVVIVTDHSSVDYQWVVDHSRLVVDTRNATQGVTRGRERVVKL